MDTISQTSPLDKLPPAEVIRDRLGSLLREVAILKKLERVADAAERAREQDRQAETAHAG